MATNADLNYSNLANYQVASGIEGTKLPSGVKDVWALSSNPALTTGNVPDFSGDVLSANPFSLGGGTTGQGGGGSAAFTFITAPQDVQYDVSADVNRISIYGTNTPPLTVGSTSMKSLSLGEALMEGFTLGKSVQQPLDKLLDLMKVSLTGGFVNVPVYTVAAGGKSYGNYVIEQVQIQEEMRDLKGDATRAMVQVSFKEVADYQINTGRDQAGAVTAGAGAGPAAATGQAAGQAANIANGAPAANPVAGAKPPPQSAAASSNSNLARSAGQQLTRIGVR